MTRKLIIVDAQYDFIEGGSLGVEGTRNAMDKLSVYLRENHGKYNEIFLTADWHLPTHCSFKENGGIWPKHCIQFSHGAAIYQPLLDALDSVKVDYTVLTKGCDEDHEEYSIFKNAVSKAYLKSMDSKSKSDVIDICGIAGDYCVKDTIKDGLIVFPNTEFNVLKNFVASIDGGKTLDDLIMQNERVICQE